AHGGDDEFAVASAEARPLFHELASRPVAGAAARRGPPVRYVLERHGPRTEPRPGTTPRGRRATSRGFDRLHRIRRKVRTELVVVELRVEVQVGHFGVEGLSARAALDGVAQDESGSCVDVKAADTAGLLRRSAGTAARAGAFAARGP